MFLLKHAEKRPNPKSKPHELSESVLRQVRAGLSKEAYENEMSRLSNEHLTSKKQSD